MVWLPQYRVAICGNLFSALTGHIPNLVTLRGDRYRQPLMFVESVERVRALEAEMLLVGHHGPIVGGRLHRPGAATDPRRHAVGSTIAPCRA